MCNKKGNPTMDIRKHRFIPNISTTSKVMVDKKRKQKRGDFSTIRRIGQVDQFLFFSIDNVN
jgi:hypothetical protein